MTREEANKILIEKVKPCVKSTEWGEAVDKVLSEQIKGRCFECIHFELDAMIDCDGVPLIGAHKICNKWGRGCKTDTNGYCFMFEGKKTQ